MELLFGKMILLLMTMIIGIFLFSTTVLALRDFVFYVIGRFNIVEPEELPDPSMKASLLNPKYLESLKQRHLIDLKDIYIPSNRQKTDY